MEPTISYSGGHCWALPLSSEGRQMHQNDQNRAGLGRRRFLGIGAVAAAGLFAPLKASAATAATAKKVPVRELSFFNTHTGERLKAAYCCDSRYEPGALTEINRILRDFRTNEV